MPLILRARLPYPHHSNPCMTEAAIRLGQIVQNRQPRPSNCPPRKPSPTSSPPPPQPGALSNSGTYTRTVIVAPKSSRNKHPLPQSRLRRRQHKKAACRTDAAPKEKKPWVRKAAQVASASSPSPSMIGSASIGKAAPQPQPQHPHRATMSISMDAEGEGEAERGLLIPGIYETSLVTDPKVLYTLIPSIPPKILHQYCLTHLAGPSISYPSISTHHHHYTRSNPLAVDE
jgi:hypothetical protein